jgi:hypothetical protein
MEQSPTCIRDDDDSHYLGHYRNAEEVMSNYILAMMTPAPPPNP